MKRHRNLFSIILLIITITIIQSKGLFPEFIIDEEEITDKPAPQETEKSDKSIVKNIKAEVMPNIKGAVKITWALNKDSDDDYIVGRSLVVPDTMEKALKALSIKVIPSGAKPEVIDSNLKAGAYYYCVLAKSRIMDRDIKLYAGQNYTINPAIIEAELYREPEKIFPQQVSLIYARIVNNSQIRVTWRNIEARGILYTIYRSNTPLDSPAKIVKAEKINVITDGRESFVDAKINRSGTYYYAVTTRDINGNEDINLIPDQSYTTSGVYVSLDIPIPVSNISARFSDAGVKITWDKTSAGVSEYLIYRYTGAIADSDRLSLAAFLGRTTEKETVYLDKNPGPGSYYYAVLTKFLNGNVLNDLIKGSNYTYEPVSLGTAVRLISLSARAAGGNIELTWKTSGNLGNKSYKILRKQGRIKSIDDLQDAEVVAYVNIEDLSYTDKNLTPGKYYYALVPESIEEEKDLSLEAGVNLVEKSIAKIKRENAGIEPPADMPEAKKPQHEIEIKRTAPPARKTVSGIDAILKNYFITGQYISALNELENFVKGSDDRNEVVRAKLFIGRTFVELKKYKEAVKYLTLKDVNDKYPKEARFWREFALSKISEGGNYIINENIK